MPLTFSTPEDYHWQVRKIVVVGPGIVGLPMAALLAAAQVRIGADAPPRVVVLQRLSSTSGWKVDAINRGGTVIGGIEPGLSQITAEAVRAARLAASADYGEAADADVILISIQTDRSGWGPDYGPLFEGLEGVAAALRRRPPDNIPLIVFESTLAPSSMTTVVRELFERHGLIDGRDILLGNSPNRVMPGRLVERVRAADKLVAGLHPLTPRLIQRLYAPIVTRATLHATNSMTAEVVKTLENAYRDVRIAFAAEIARYCDRHDVSFYQVRDAVNARLSQSDGASASATAVPHGAILVPTVGVGGHCLPKDGILLWWRRIESGALTRASLILEARRINDDSPAAALALAEALAGPLTGVRVTLLGAAYRFDSEDTRNSPSLELARLLRERGCIVRIHDPYVRPGDANLARSGFTAAFTHDLTQALREAEVTILCVAHSVYARDLAGIVRAGACLRAVIDGANAWQESEARACGKSYAGIGRGGATPDPDLVEFVTASFRAVETGLANEVAALCRFLNERYARDAFNRVEFSEVQRLAATCPTGCRIVATAPVRQVPAYRGFATRLARCALAAGADR